MSTRHRACVLSVLCLVSLSIAPAQAFDIGGMLNSAQKIAEVAGRDSNKEGEERLIGEQAAREILGKAPLAPLPTLQKYVNQVGRLVARNSARPGVEWRFAVIDDASANAWAAPDGYIFITTGMIADMQTEAELAGVLAHEITHVVEKHHLKAVQQAAQRSKLIDLAAVTRDVAGSHGANTASLTVSPQLQALRDNITQLYDKGLSRSDELEADKLGVELAARSGYDPYGLPTVLQALAARGKDDPSMANFTRTHPSIDERLKKLEPVMDKLDPRLLPGRDLGERFRRYVP
jgi:beta-barrel assembly-enhancing protease